MDTTTLNQRVLAHLPPHLHPVASLGAVWTDLGRVQAVLVVLSWQNGAQVTYQADPDGESLGVFRASRVNGEGKKFASLSRAVKWAQGGSQ